MGLVQLGMPASELSPLAIRTRPHVTCMATGLARRRGVDRGGGMEAARNCVDHHALTVCLWRRGGIVSDSGSRCGMVRVAVRKSRSDDGQQSLMAAVSHGALPNQLPWDALRARDEVARSTRNRRIAGHSL